jgi:type IV secretory pathway TrbD component
VDHVDRKHRLHASLTEVQLIAGVERSLAIVNWTLTLAIVMRTGMWLLLIVGAATHMILRQVTKKDPQFRVIYQRFVGQGHRYDPWPQAAKSARYKRPPGFDQEGLC